MSSLTLFIYAYKTKAHY